MFVFGRAVLGYDFFPFHDRICQFHRENRGKDKLILAPRDHYKTTLLTITQTLHEIACNPDIHILVVSGNWRHATKMMWEIQQQMLRNAMLYKLWPNIFPQERDGYQKMTESVVIVPRDTKAKEPTVTVGTPNSDLVSQHYHKIILDDVVNLENTRTKEQIQKLIEWFHTLEPLVIRDDAARQAGFPCDMDVVGTRWSYDDLYGYILENCKERFRFFVCGVYDEAGSPVFPERRGKEWIREKRETLPSYVFSHQYLNIPTDPETAPFQADQVKFYDDEELEDKELTTVMTVDPAISLMKTADYTAIVVASITLDGHVYVREIVNQRLQMYDLVDTIILKANKWKPVIIGVETVGFQRAIGMVLDDQMLRRGMLFNLHEIRRPKDKTKYDRIMRLEYYFRQGRIHIKRDMDELYTQIIRFPKTKHDDLLDALSDVTDLGVDLTGSVEVKYGMESPYSPLCELTGV